MKVYTRSELRKLPAQRWVMKGIIAEGTLGWIISEWGHGKSFVALDWAAHIVLGRNWHGHKVRQANVMYVSAEGLPARRLDAWEQHFGAEIPDGLVVADGIDLQKPDHTDLLLELIEDYEIGLVFYDTQHAVNGGETEEDAAVAQESLRQVRSEFPGIVQFLVHHRGKDASRGGRGTSAWPAALDMIYEIDADDPHLLMKLKRTKQRDEGYMPDMCLKLKEIVLGVDEDGDEISSCVVVPAIAEDEGIPTIVIDDLEPVVMEILQEHGGISRRELLKLLRKGSHQLGDTRLKHLLDGLVRHGRIDHENRCL